MIQHIKQLFEETKTIILPGLGALTITNPDSGELMFMPYLKHDDGVLAKYIASKEGISEEDAKAKIKAEVEKITAEVGAGKSVPFGEFGQFINELGDIAFENKTDEKPAESAPEEVVAAAPTIPKTKETEATKPVEKTKPVEETKPAEETKSVKETKPEVKEEPKATVPEKKETSAPVEEKPAEKEAPSDAKKTLADEIKESEKELLKKPVSEEKKADPPKPVVEKKIDTPATNKTIAEEIAEAEVKKEKVVTPPPTKKETVSKKEMNILEKEEVAANQKKLEKLRKEKEAKKVKKKRGAGFYILMVFIILIVGGGTYVGLNYDQVKEYIPFLSDKKTPENKGDEEVDKMHELIGEDPSAEETSTPVEDSVNNATPEIEEAPVVTEKPPVVAEAPEKKPVKKPVSTSNNQPYHIVAGVFSSPENAERLAKKISDMGYPAKTFARGSQTVVSVQSFASQAEAQSALANTKDAAPNGWVLKWNQ